MTTLPAMSLSASPAPATSLAGIRSGCAALHRVLNGFIILAVAAQFYTVGLVMFGAAGMLPHRILGTALLAVGLLSVIAAAGAGRTRARPLAALGLLGLLLLQPALAFGLRRTAPALAALHAVNGLVILALAVRLALRRVAP